MPALSPTWEGKTKGVNVSNLTRQEAIRECKRLWKEIKKSGLYKENFLDTPAGKVWLDKHYNYDCPLCEYTKNSNCSQTCPLYQQYYEGCGSLGYHYLSDRWFRAVEGLKE